METKIVNAHITGTMLGYEDHGIMTCMVYLDYGDSSGQGFGGFVLDSKEKRAYNPAGIRFITSILNTVGVGTWEGLKGRYIRVKIKDMGTDRKILAIGHVLEDKWFDPKEFLEGYYPPEGK